MTNEEIALQILRGSAELCPLLWEQVKKLLYMWARRYYNANREAFKRAGVELSDLEQELYFAFRQAVQYYKPDSGYNFTTFLKYPFRNTCRRLLGRNQREPDPLNNCTSLDRPAKEEEAGGATIGDLQPDPQSSAFIDNLERAALAEIVRAEVDRLPERLSDMVKLYYFDGLNYEQIGVQLDVSGSFVGQSLSKARRELRKSRELRSLYLECGRAHPSPRGYYPEWSPERFEETRARQRLEREAATSRGSEQLAAELRELLEVIHRANLGE